MRILITGGAGFLGRALGIKLKKMGHNVISFSRGDYPYLQEIGIEAYRGDLASEEAVVEASKKCDVVFHVGAKAGVWGSYEDYYKPNVLGTKNVIKACLKNNIQRLVYTSSPSVVFSKRGHEGANESEDYPDQYLNSYGKTKALAEKMVIDANSENLATISLRPHLIWGPGDNHLIPRLISRAKAGRLRIIGNGENLVDSVYIDNAVDAHICALEKLYPGSLVSGKSYFITNGEPIPMKNLLNRVLKAADITPVEKKIPKKIAFILGAIMESIYKIFKIKGEPLMTRFVALELSVPHWYDISKARKELDYNPKISMKEGFEKLKAYFLQSNK